MSCRYCLITAVLFFTTLWLCACVGTPFWRTTPIIEKISNDLGTLGRTFPIIQNAADFFTRKIPFEIKFYTGIIYSCLYAGVGDLKTEVNEALNGKISEHCAMNEDIRVKLLGNNQLAVAITAIPTEEKMAIPCLIGVIFVGISTALSMWNCCCCSNGLSLLLVVLFLFAGLISMVYSLINVMMFMTINSYSSYGFIIGQMLTLILTLWSLSYFVNYRRRQREVRQDELGFIRVKT